MSENYELIQRGFRILHPLMADYIEREFKRAYGADHWRQEVCLALSEQDHLPDFSDDNASINSLDIMNCLRLIDRRWNDVFRSKLSQDYRTWSRELLSVRNKVAHVSGRDFAQEYAERALNTMALVCEAFDAEGTGKIRALYRTLRYGSEDGSVAAAPSVPARPTSNEGVMTKAFGQHLPSWRDVMQPHPDVAEGHYRKAEFAANLAQVARKEGAVEYRDPVEFFARTYMTAGMTGLLVEALQRLSGQGGEPVIQLKTAFGGGKTHSMLALYHMVHMGRVGVSVDRVPCLKPIMERAGLQKLPDAHIAVIVGTSLNPAGKRNPANLPKYTVSTIWGEMAYQLVTSAGKPELYRIVSDADRNRVSPGSQALKELFNSCGPCLILIDELVAYARKIYGKKELPAGSYENLITFIQELTEAARASDNSVVVASIPESEIEIVGEAGRTVLDTIEHTFGRMESIWTPVAANEGFEIVRRRLFLDCKDPAARDRVCDEFSKMYREKASDFPTEAKEVAYRDRMVSCYPIHPEVFDRLYEDWATLDRFQRTRGVLRLMASVIHELWMSGDASAMILPGSIPLNTPNVREELVRYLPETWNSIVDREVDGKDSAPYQVDHRTPRYGQKLAARRVARTIMLGTAPSTLALRDQSLRGLEASRIRLGVVQPGESIPDFNDALYTLQTSLAYLYSSQNGTRFWYDTKPTLRKTAEDRASQVSDEDVLAELDKRLRKLRREEPFAGLHICPASSNDIPDEQTMRLVILKPKDTFRRSNGEMDGPARVAVENDLAMRGSTPRIYQNMLAFVAPDHVRLQELGVDVKRFLAWTSIISDKDDLNLDVRQGREAESNRQRSDAKVERGIREAYRWLLVPSIDLTQDIKKIQWEASDLGGGEDGIVSKAARKMLQEEQVIREWSPALLKMSLDDLLWKDADSVEIGRLWKNLCTYCYLPRLAGYDVLTEAIIKGTGSSEFFGVAAGYEEDRYLDLKLNETVPSITQSDLLVKPAVARKQLAEERVPACAETDVGQEGGRAPQSDGSFWRPEPFPRTEPFQQPDSGAEAGAPPRRTHFSMSVKLDNTRINKNVNACVNEVIQPLTELPGANVTVTLEVEADVPQGIPDATCRAVSENCRTLRSQSFQFTDD